MTKPRVTTKTVSLLRRIAVRLLELAAELDSHDARETRKDPRLRRKARKA